MGGLRTFEGEGGLPVCLVLWVGSQLGLYDKGGLLGVG